MKWISVKDHLPTKEGLYWVAIYSPKKESGFFHTREVKIVEIGYFLSFEEKIEENDNIVTYQKKYKWDDSSCYTNGKIIAWAYYNPPEFPEEFLNENEKSQSSNG